MHKLFIVAALLASSASAQPVPPNPPKPRCALNDAYDAKNPFARILRGELPVSKVAEDRLVMAFIPLGWKHEGHVLVIPKRAVRNLLDLSDREMVAIKHMVARLAVAQQRAFGSTGFTLEQNNGRNQDVCHAHFHVIPNTAEVSLRHATRAEMDDVAARLKAALPSS